MRRGLALLVLLVGCTADKAPPDVPDYGPEAGGKEDSVTRPAVTMRIAYGDVVDAALGSGVRYRAFQFTGQAGQIVDAHAQGLDDTDTVLYLYKVSRITGRPYGKPVGYDDDTAQDGWSLRKGAPFNPLSSSIIGAVLPDDRDYALVLTTYDHGPGRAIVEVEVTGAQLPSTIPPFDGTGPATPIHFVEGTRDVLSATRQAPSAEIQHAVQAATSQLVVSAAVYRADPVALAAALADPARRADLAYGLLLGDPNTSGYDASFTSIAPADAGAALMQAAVPEGNSGLAAVVDYVLAAMFGDAAFQAGDVQTYRLHWDNADDTNAEGIVALEPGTGEIRVLAIDNPP